MPQLPTNWLIRGLRTQWISTSQGVKRIQELCAQEDAPMDVVEQLLQNVLKRPDIGTYAGDLFVLLYKKKPAALMALIQATPATYRCPKGQRILDYMLGMPIPEASGPWLQELRLKASQIKESINESVDGMTAMERATMSMEPSYVMILFALGASIPTQSLYAIYGRAVLYLRSGHSVAEFIDIWKLFLRLGGVSLEPYAPLIERIDQDTRLDSALNQELKRWVWQRGKEIEDDEN